jgi:hypothetical protein
MKKSLVKILALLMIAAMVFSLAACGKDKDNGSTTDESTTLAETTNGEVNETEAQTGEDTTAAEDASETEAQTGEDGETTTLKEGETGAVTTTGLPKTTAEILKAYTDVMNKAKKDKPAHKKKEFQALPKEHQHMEGGLLKAILPLADLFMTKEDKAETWNVEKGNDMKWFPVYESDKGCLLTDTNAIKSAKSEELSNGNYKLTIILKDEKNPEPYKPATGATSNTGRMFSPLSRTEIDNTLLGDSRVSAVVKNVKYDLRYFDCTAVLVYNPKNNQIVSLDQYMSVFIDIQDGKILLSTLKGTAILNNTMKVWDLQY